MSCARCSYVITKSAYLPHDATILPVYNPLPGSWFAAAYIPNWNEQMQQESVVVLPILCPTYEKLDQNLQNCPPNKN
ncbi:uncharacterized protein LOC135202485 isoform X3 [Macrobrachium nipponense]|uniref:uncharacterized protein LOC135202485 isoform X3 n=1 Tax=Macrobrachium nipponense TaxID=159736 RepID=UPI0030C7C164